MFCSNECYQKSQQRYHQYECSVIEKLLKSGSVHITLRIFFIALSTFVGSIEKLKDFMNQMKNESSSIFDLDLRNQNNEIDKKLLLSLLSLIKSQKIFPLQMHEEIIKNHPILKVIWNKNQDFIKQFLLQLCQISDLNFHGIFSGTSQNIQTQNPSTLFQNLQQSIGSGSFLFASMINHSCANNVVRICVEGNIIYVVCRPISKGAQLFDCYK